MQEVKLPQMGQSVEEAEIVEWFKQEGDAVEEGEPLFSIQTDKAEIECESPASGVLRKILLEPGVEVPVFTVVALVGVADEPLPDLADFGTGAVGQTASTAAAAVPEDTAEQAPVAAVSAPPAPATDVSKGVSPRARKLATAHHVNTDALQGTGPNGRVIEEDVQAYIDRLTSARITPTAKRLAASQGLDPSSLQGTGVGGKITKADVAGAVPEEAKPAPVAGTGQVQRIPLTPMREIIARRMSESKYSAPHYYVTVKVDMLNVKKARAAITRFKASYNDFVLYATIRALEEYPHVNARWCGDAIEQVGDINLGIAVALPTGLIVPVVKQAQLLSFEGLCAESKAVVEKARNGKLTPDDYTGNTFTISNMGVFGVDNFTAIINQPDSGIIAVGQMKDQAVVIDGGIHIRPMMKLTMSSDHRVIDGAVAAQFMGRLRAILETAEF